MISFFKKFHFGDCHELVEAREKDIRDIKYNQECLYKKIDQLKIELEKEKEKVKKFSTPALNLDYHGQKSMPVSEENKKEWEDIEKKNREILGITPPTPEPVKIRPLFNKIQPDNEWPHKKKKHKGK